MSKQQRLRILPFETNTITIRSQLLGRRIRSGGCFQPRCFLRAACCPTRNGRAPRPRPDSAGPLPTLMPLGSVGRSLAALPYRSVRFPDSPRTSISRSPARRWSDWAVLLDQQQWTARAWRMVPLKVPTAHTLVGELAATPLRSLLEPGLGLATCSHLVPFHRRIRVLSPRPLAALPTAHALPAEVTTTLLRKLSFRGPPRSGLATCSHFRPFQCRIRVWSAPPFDEKPTAHAFAADVAPMPLSESLIPGVGLGTCFHRVPFQCRIRFFSPPPPEKLPTAQALPWEVAVTLNRSRSTPGSGLGTCFHPLPFQCRMSVRFAVLLLKVPTAQTSDADTARTALSSLSALPGFGLSNCAQERPFQCRIMALVPAPSEKPPTAQMSAGETARMLVRKLLALPGSGLGTTFHAVPVQCSMRVWFAPLLKSKPTAQASQGESTVVLNSVLSDVPGFGGCVPDQLSQVAAKAPGDQSRVSIPAGTSAAASAVTKRRR